MCSTRTSGHGVRAARVARERYAGHGSGDQPGDQLADRGSALGELGLPGDQHHDAGHGRHRHGDGDAGDRARPAGEGSGGVDPNLTAVEQQSLLARCDAAIAAARYVLSTRQNVDGGWASYQPGLPGKERGAIMTEEPTAPNLDGFKAQVEFTLNPPADLGDPATEDVTGRALFALGKSGVTKDDPSVKKAIQFLIDQQDTNDGWWGRWVVNYSASTAWVLRGLAAVGADQAAFVQKGAAFLIGRQRPDGGWLDSVESYRKPAFTVPLVPETPSNPCLTGLVLCALIDLRWAGPEVQRGIDFLRKYHYEKGWNQPTVADTLHSLYPPALFYTLPETIRQLPLEALALFKKQQAAAPLVPRIPVHLTAPAPDPLRALQGPLTRNQVDELKRQGDLEADAVIERIWTQTDHMPPQARVGALFQSLVKIADLTDGSSVDGLPVSGKAKKAAIPLPLPNLGLDPKRLANAQALFRQSGFGVPLVLFCSSLPQCYAVPYGAKVLLASGRLATNPRGRMIETAQLVFDVLSPDGLVAVSDKEIKESLQAGRTPPGRGLRTARKVRLMHAAIRKLVGRRATAPLRSANSRCWGP